MMPLRCNVLLIARDRRTGQVARVAAGHNLVVDKGRELISRMLAEETGWNTGVTYCALGTNNTTPTTAQTLLVAEGKRKAVTQVLRAGYRVQYRTYFLASESNINIQETGLFGHSTATATLNTGEMLNRALLSYDNSAGLKDLTVVHEIQYG